MLRRTTMNQQRGSIIVHVLCCINTFHACAVCVSVLHLQGVTAVAGFRTGAAAGLRRWGGGLGVLPLEAVLDVRGPPSETHPQTKIQLYMIPLHCFHIKKWGLIVIIQAHPKAGIICIFMLRQSNLVIHSPAPASIHPHIPNHPHPYAHIPIYPYLTPHPYAPHPPPSLPSLYIRSAAPN